MRELKIAYGNSRTAKFWSNKVITFDELCGRLEVPVRTSETAEEYKMMKKTEREETKDKGGFVAGHLKNNSRKVENVECRSMLVFDLDEVADGVMEKVMGLSYESCVYSTHSHTPEKPRIRVLVPTARDMTVDEFNAVARYFAAENNFLNTVDPCSFKPNQLMYWPTCPSNGEYIFKKIKGEWLDPDKVLSAHPLWRDCSLLPTTPKESKAKEYSKTKQKDPLEKEGVVGAFCRCYSITAVIEEFLKDLYAPSAVEGRYDYVPGEGTAGVVVYEDKWAYSHHATDPACGRLLNSFDLVRVHKFGDDKDSFGAMSEFALTLSKVSVEVMKEKQEKAKADFEGDDDWAGKLQRDKRGNVANSLHNIRLILENDPMLKNIVFNQLADGMEIKGEVPWKHPARFWRDADDAQLICYVDANYGSFSAHNYQIGVQKVTDDRSYHPIRSYLESLPPWDGVERVETLLVDYLGAGDSEYVRAVTRKQICAAVARIYNPGKKFDSITVLNGPQGIGKSTLIAKLGMDWYSDSLSLSDMNDKTAAEKLQGYWIIEIGELAGMKKADVDKVKAFISRQDDKYRASFGRRVTPHPRQCIFFGTTNSETGYLRDVTGNRRFWTVKVNGESRKKPWELTEEEVGQIWAEALHYVREGENLYLDENLEEESRKQQNSAMEQDEREGFVREFLEMLLPENWAEMDLYQRRSFLDGDSISAVGKVKRETVCNMEIWCECFGKRREDIKPSDSYAIAAIMARIENWEKSGSSKHHPIYGRQRVYRRSCS